MRQLIEDTDQNATDGFQALSAEFVQRVFIGVPIVVFPGIARRFALRRCLMSGDR